MTCSFDGCDLQALMVQVTADKREFLICEECFFLVRGTFLHLPIPFIHPNHEIELFD